MQRCSTGCRLLLITPALFVLLQVALALHQHHSESYYDARDAHHHPYPAACCNDHHKHDSLSFLASHGILPEPFYQTIRTQDTPRTPFNILIADPSQSRAPPYSNALLKA